jgi:uncharacterized protein (DUF2147 family)
MAVWLFAGAPELRADTPASPVGRWSTEDHGGVVQIAPCGGALCGTIVGLNTFRNGVAPRDVHGGSQCHLALLDDLKFHPGDGRWHGTVTNPIDGRTYDAEVWVPQDGTLRLRGYVGVPLLGSTQYWQPFVGTVDSDCHFHEVRRG